MAPRRSARSDESPLAVREQGWASDRVHWRGSTLRGGSTSPVATLAIPVRSPRPTVPGRLLWASHSGEEKHGPFAEHAATLFRFFRGPTSWGEFLRREAGRLVRFFRAPVSSGLFLRRGCVQLVRFFRFFRWPRGRVFSGPMELPSPGSTRSRTRVVNRRRRGWDGRRACGSSCIATKETKYPSRGRVTIAGLRGPTYERNEITKSGMEADVDRPVALTMRSYEGDELNEPSLNKPPHAAARQADRRPAPTDLETTWPHPVPKERSMSELACRSRYRIVGGAEGSCPSRWPPAAYGCPARDEPEIMREPAPPAPGRTP